jgi:uncharacterized protein (TIGR00159 family)
VFQILWQVFIVLLIILFQPEIRQVLERVNPFQNLGWHRYRTPPPWLDTLAKGCFRLAAKRIGALVVIERRDRVHDLITCSHHIEGEPTFELLFGIFHKASPFHDGAVVIRDGWVNAASCYLPISQAQDIPKEWGTRHRAALGITERCDAWAIIISEERGEVAFARSAKIRHVGGAEELAADLFKAFAPPDAGKRRFFKRLAALATNRWKEKFGTFALVAIFWVLFAGQQDFEATIRVPVEVSRLPNKVAILEPERAEVAVTARGLRKDISTLSPKSVAVKLDLSMAALGQTTYRIVRSQVALPNDRIDIVKIDPQVITFTFKYE